MHKYFRYEDHRCRHHAGGRDRRFTAASANPFEALFGPHRPQVQAPAYANPVRRRQ